MIVEAVKPHRAVGISRRPGDVYHVNRATGKHLVECRLARLVDDQEGWATHHGRELRTAPVEDQPWPMVVACLNIWNDTPALRQTLPTWIDQVDALVVADGPYKTTGAKRAKSTDGLDEFLAEVIPTTQVGWGGTASLPAKIWPDQHQKRTALLQYAADLFPGALLFIVDADEFVGNADKIRSSPQGDVLWVTVSSKLYARPYGQPRLIRAMPDLAYRGRHHWLYAGDRLLATHQYGGTGFEHRLSPVTIRNERGLGHTSDRARAKRQHAQAQLVVEVQAATPRGEKSDRQIGAREALRIAACTTYDAGGVGYRLHTALNTTTPHSSVFIRRGQDNPFQMPRQYDADHCPELSKRLLEEADVIHCHLDYTVPDSFRVRPKTLVIHHHGTMYRKAPGPHYYNAIDHLRADLRLVSNLELLGYGIDLHWLPNPVSVARLRRLRAQVYQPSDTFRVSHSPSKRHLKGTEDFLSAVDTLQKRGLPVEAVLIEGVSHAESLRLKATCDACFDSFWLGLQCSGLEAAAMGQPVIAGDPLVKERYHMLVGLCPYTYAGDARELAGALERLATDARWAESEGARVGRYVEEWHDDAAVALRYLDLLDDSTHWRAAKQVTPTAKAAA